MGADLVRCFIQAFGLRLEPYEYDWLRFVCTDETDVAEPRGVAAFIAVRAATCCCVLLGVAQVFGATTYAC